MRLVVQYLKRNNLWNNYLLGVCYAVLTALNNVFVPQSWFEIWYYRGIFQLWRTVYDFTLGALPFPLVYLLAALLLIVVIRRWRKPNKPPLWLRVAGWLSWIYVFFLWLWGFNYNVPNIQQRLSLGRPELNDTMILDEIKVVAQLLNEERGTIIAFDRIDYDQVEAKVRPLLVEVLESWDLPTSGQVRVRKLKPDGILLRWATAGVYLPFVSEGHLDGGLHPIQWGSTCAHEMAHGYGVTNEGECNFVAVITCLRSDDPYLRYSGLMLYFRYLAANVFYNEQMKSQVLAILDQEIISDLEEIRNKLDDFPDILPEVRHWIYELYLKNNGVESGLKSYGQMVNLMIDYQAKKDPDLLR